VQNPPNNGTQVPVGPLGINVTAVNGFDISPVNNTALLAAQVGNSMSSQLYVVNLATGMATFVGPVPGGAPLRGFAIAGGTAASATVDFDGDNKTDYSVFRTSNNVWYIANSSAGSQTFTFTQFGLTGDIFTPGDYDGDGRDDISVWRAGIFYVLRSSTNQITAYQFGINGDEPVARDYDGDGRTDYAVVRRTGGQLILYINNSSNNSFRIEQFGLEQDVTAPGDYDGDGRFDLAVYRTPASGQGTFFVNGSTTGFRAQGFGIAGDLVVPGDYDGDGKTDFAVVRQGSPYRWFILRSSDNSFYQVDLGTKPHLPTQGDYDGDGKTDVSVYDPGIGAFYTYQSSNGALRFYRFGQNGDIPIASFDTH
jgi:spore coat protein A, manganese oxidase